MVKAVQTIRIIGNYPIDSIVISGTNLSVLYANKSELVHFKVKKFLRKRETENIYLYILHVCNMCIYIYRRSNVYIRPLHFQ